MSCSALQSRHRGVPVKKEALAITDSDNQTSSVCRSNWTRLMQEQNLTLDQMSERLVLIPLAGRCSGI